MLDVSRRQFLSYSASGLALAAAGASGPAAFAAMGPNDKFDLVVKGGEVLDPSQNLRARRDIGIRFGMIEAVEADIPADKALRVSERGRQARYAGPHRPARPRVPLRLRHRHSRRRAAVLPGHHDDRVGRRCRRQQFRGLPPPHRAADAHAALCVRAYRQHRPGRLSRAGALQHRFRPGRRCRQGGGGERRHRARREGAHVRERHRQARHRAVEAGDTGLREGRRRQGHVPHRRRRDARS